MNEQRLTMAEFEDAMAVSGREDEPDSGGKIVTEENVLVFFSSLTSGEASVLAEKINKQAESSKFTPGQLLAQLVEKEFEAGTS